MKKIALILLPALALFTSCLKDKTKPVEQNEDCFEQSYQYNIRPIIESSCKTGLGPQTGCHDAWIDEYSNIVPYIQNGSWETEIFIDKTMPPPGNSFGIDSLQQYELDAMECWIAQGYPEN